MSWWQKIFVVLKYGKWGGPGWSAGHWCQDDEIPDFNEPPAYDWLDTQFKEHDKSFNDPNQDNVKDILFANLKLIGKMFYGMFKYQTIVFYQLFAIIGFLIALIPTAIYFGIRYLINRK